MSPNFFQKFNQNISPDIGRIIDESLATFKKTVWIMGVGMILLAVVGGILSMLVFSFTLGITSLEQFVQDSPYLQHDTTYLLVNAGLGIVMAGLMAPITAGFYKINHLAKTNQDFSVGTLFDYYSSSYTKELIVYGVLVALITNVISLGLTYLDMITMAAIFQLIIGFLLIFGVPLIIFENQNASEAINYSAKIAIRNPVAIILSMLFAFLIAVLGIVAICIGIIFTIGYFYSMLYTLYDNIIPIENKNPLDEIGLE
ncbi:hypothetical protein [Flavobacterium urocaniciphilum]|uniref:Beta-carotene 15,15'-monooxygenase n=1 Tax=Flavobacterium urocaniciphilum TaxID=1299341 RepID=A0A1H8Z7P8_9FLAO|nr:hypothetical protein [Flavobacterium urocaniciphilum]SEP60277.1 hypothetical protein SAMN05444005_101532 [Flavobacterium urocaniciphilum]